MFQLLFQIYFTLLYLTIVNTFLKWINFLKFVFIKDQVAIHLQRTDSPPEKDKY